MLKVIGKVYLLALAAFFLLIIAASAIQLPGNIDRYDYEPEDTWLGLLWLSVSLCLCFYFCLGVLTSIRAIQVSKIAFRLFDGVVLIITVATIAGAILSERDEFLLVPGLVVTIGMITQIALRKDAENSA